MCSRHLKSPASSQWVQTFYQLASIYADLRKETLTVKHVEILTMGFLDSIKSKVIFQLLSQSTAAINSKQPLIHNVASMRASSCVARRKRSVIRKKTGHNLTRHDFVENTKTKVCFGVLPDHSPPQCCRRKLRHAPQKPLPFCINLNSKHFPQDDNFDQPGRGRVEML